MRNLFIILFILMATFLIGCSSETETPEPPTAAPEQAEAPADTPTPAPTNTPEAETEEVEQEQAAPAPSLGGKFAFAVYDEPAGTYNVYTANADGSNRQMIMAEASQPDLNSDGSRIIFRSWKGDNRGLIEQGVDGSPGWNLNIHFEAGRPKFSPDNMSFLFHSKEAGDKYAIYMTQSTDYNVLRRESNPIEGEAPAWTPNGQSFVSKSCAGTGCGLFFSNIDGSNTLQLTEDLSDTNPDVSPNGQTIAYMSEGSGDWDVFSINVDGSNKRQLTTDNALDGLPIWSPDGRTVAFVSNRGGEWAMWAMNPDGSNQRQLFELGGSIDGIVQLDRANSWGWREENISWAP